MDYIARAVSADGFLRIYACRTTDTVAEAARIHDLSATAAAALGRHPHRGGHDGRDDKG